MANSYYQLVQLLHIKFCGHRNMKPLQVIIDTTGSRECCGHINILFLSLMTSTLARFPIGQERIGDLITQSKQKIKVTQKILSSISSFRSPCLDRPPPQLLLKIQ